DDGGRQPHTAQGDQERVFATHFVPEPAKHEGSERPDQETNREERYSAEEGRHRVALLEELDGEDRGQAAEDVEVVPLDDVADGCGDDDTAEFFQRNIRYWHKFSSLFRQNMIPNLLVSGSATGMAAVSPWRRVPGASVLP